MHLIFFDTKDRYQLFPFTHTRPIADIRCGIMTVRERWHHIVQTNQSGTCTESYLEQVFNTNIELSESALYINGSVIANANLSSQILGLNINEALYANQELIAFHSENNTINWSSILDEANKLKPIEANETPLFIKHIWDIFTFNEAAVKIDWQLLTAGRKREIIPQYVTTICPENIFIEPGAILSPCILNASTGYIYIGKDAEVMDGAMVRGSLALGEHAVLKMGAKIYGATTIGPGCKVGGEIGNSVFFANSNKGHDGYVGNAVIGEWCNLGADTNASNLKNNYDEIKVWNEHENRSVKSGLQFCGLMMGDHSKCGINTMFNTATVVGVSCNIFGGDFLSKFIPSFSWGSNKKMESYQLEKAIDTANRMMQRRNKSLSKAEQNMFQFIFELSAHARSLLS